MKATLCPICATDGADREVYPANFRLADLTPEVFSARRVPDRIHYRMVRCSTCGLLRSNPILPPEHLARLYGSSRFTYGAETAFARRTYGRYLERACRWAQSRAALLEIGCGNGFFLEEALRRGFQEVAGVEPSADAIRRAADPVRARIRPGLYEADSYPGRSFDLICAFQVFDHVPDPAALVRAAHLHLRDRGVVLFVNHDSGGWLNRLLGETSPIIDVEHTVLFDRVTIRRLLERHGFAVREVFGVKNTYPAHYWARLAPIPPALKSRALPLLERWSVGRLPLTLGGGNLGVIATKG